MRACFAFLPLTVVARKEGDEKRDDLPRDDGGDLPVVGQVTTDGGELEASEVGQGTVGECADSQARDDNERQTQQRGQPRGRRHGQLCLSGIHGSRGGFGGKIASLDLGAELVVGAHSKERNVGSHFRLQNMDLRVVAFALRDGRKKPAPFPR